MNQIAKPLVEELVPAQLSANSIDQLNISLVEELVPAQYENWFITYRNIRNGNHIFTCLIRQGIFTLMPYAN